MLEHSPARSGNHPSLKLAMTIDEFCALHSLSRAMLYKLERQGLAPQTMNVGVKRLISQEAAAKWRAAREADAVAARGGADTPQIPDLRNQPTDE
jgi:predicted DNA-binding transcriptional regulator AlpA